MARGGSRRSRKSQAKKKKKRKPAKAKKPSTRPPTFRGRIVQRQCIISLHLGKPLVQGTEQTSLVPVEAIVDTGATATAIRPDVAKQLRLPLTGYRPMTSATEQNKRCPVVAACIGFHTGDGVFTKNFQVAVMPIAVPMLVGMDILGSGTLTVEGPLDRWSFKLTKIHKPRQNRSKS